MKGFLQKLGWYLTFFFLGGLLTLYLVAKYIGFNTTKVDVKIAKIKNKRVKGDVDTTVPIVIEKPKKREKKRKGKQ